MVFALLNKINAKAEIEKKILLNGLTDFDIASQKCPFGIPLSKLLKQFPLAKHDGHQS